MNFSHNGEMPRIQLFGDVWYNSVKEDLEKRNGERSATLI